MLNYFHRLTEYYRRRAVAPMIVLLIAYSSAGIAQESFAAHLDELLDGPQGISLVKEDKQALRDVLASFSPTIRDNDADFRMARTRIIIEQITHTVATFPRDEFATPVQRESAIASFKLGLCNLSVAPLYRKQSSQVLDSQISGLCETVVTAAKALYSDIGGTAAEDALRKNVKEYYERLSVNSLSPILKAPLTDEQYAMLLDQMNSGASDTNPLGLWPNGHFSPNWDDMSSDEQRDYIEQHAHVLAKHAGSSLKKILRLVIPYYAENAHTETLSTRLSAKERSEIDALQEAAAKELSELPAKIVAASVFEMNVKTDLTIQALTLQSQITSKAVREISRSADNAIESVPNNAEVAISDEKSTPPSFDPKNDIADSVYSKNTIPTTIVILAIVLVSATAVFLTMRRKRFL